MHTEDQRYEWLLKHWLTKQFLEESAENREKLRNQDSGRKPLFYFFKGFWSFFFNMSINKLFHIITSYFKFIWQLINYFKLNSTASRENRIILLFKHRMSWKFGWSQFYCISHSTAAFKRITFSGNINWKIEFLESFKLSWYATTYVSLIWLAVRGWKRVIKIRLIRLLVHLWQRDTGISSWTYRIIQKPVRHYTC